MNRFGVCLALAIAASGCQRCNKGETGSDRPTSEWLEGRLPAEAGAPVDGGRLVVRAMYEPDGLNYLDESFRDGWTSRMTRNTIFESLLEIDPVDYSLKPQLAESFEESPDHLVHTFHLRKGVKFHDGTELTARDVIAVLDAVKDPKKPTDSVRADFVSLASWKALDDRTVELTWSRIEPLRLRQVAKLPIYPA